MIVVEQLNNPLQRYEVAHDFYELVYVEDGSYGVRIHDRVYQGEAGACFLFPPGLIHGPQGTGHQHLVIVLWDVQGPWEGLPKTKPTCGRDEEGAIRQCLRWLSGWLLEADLDEDACASLLRVMLHHMTAPPAAESGTLVERARSALEMRPECPLTLHDLAAHLRVSPTHIARLFRQAYGRSPMAYRRQYRLDRAIELLREPGRSVGEVAQLVGYSSASHVSNALWKERQTRPRDIARVGRPPRDEPQRDTP